MQTNRLQQGRAKRDQYQAIIDAAGRPDFEAAERRARELRRENQRRAMAAGGVA